MSEQLPLFDDDQPHPPPAAVAVTRYVIPPGTPVSRCKSCQAAIYWVTTPSGAHMPLSAALIELSADGSRSAAPHWIDCPSREQHRRK